MTKEEFVDNVRELLREGKQNLTLSELELKGIKGYYDGLKNKEILASANCNCTEGHFRREMSKFFEKITNAFNHVTGENREKIRKEKFVPLIEEYINLKNKSQIINKINVENNDKIKIFEKLNNELKIKRPMTAAIIKSYLSDDPKIQNSNLKELIEKIKDYEESFLFSLLHNLAHDQRLDDPLIQSIFEQTVNDLKMQTNISDLDYEQLTSTQLERIELPKEGLEAYLIIKVDSSKNLQYKNITTIENIEKYLIRAWFWRLNPNNIQNKDIKHIPLYDHNHTLTHIINDCRERSEEITSVEFFADEKLLSSDFESWEYKSEFKPNTKLKENYFVNSRLSERSSLDKTSDPYKKWIKKWEKLQNETIIVEDIQDNDCKHHCRRQENLTLWINLCDCKQSHEEMLIEIASEGIPLALWSRRYNLSPTHREEINALVSNQPITELPKLIHEARNPPEKQESQSDYFGNHLSLLLEDPNRMPPFHYLTSQHLG